MGESITKFKPMYSFLLDVMKTLAIYEIKDGKLWRLQAFPPYLGNDVPAASASD